jgi:hypothetical protein
MHFEGDAALSRHVETYFDAMGSGQPPQGAAVWQTHHRSLIIIVGTFLG